MSRPTSEGEDRPPIQSITDGIVPLTPLQRLLASRYRVQPRTQSLRTVEGGIVGTSARDATFAEISNVLNGGEHRAIGVTPLPFEADFHVEEARREEATRIARANRGKGSGRNRT